MLDTLLTIKWTKLLTVFRHNTWHQLEDVGEALNKSLKVLGLDYGNYLETHLIL